MLHIHLLLSILWSILPSWRAPGGTFLISWQHLETHFSPWNNFGDEISTAKKIIWKSWTSNFLPRITTTDMLLSELQFLSRPNLKQWSQKLLGVRVDYPRHLLDYQTNRLPKIIKFEVIQNKICLFGKSYLLFYHIVLEGSHNWYSINFLLLNQQVKGSMDMYSTVYSV